MTGCRCSCAPSTDRWGWQFATAGSDYQGKSGSITFAPGETIKTITIVVNGDRDKESNETFFVDLFGPSSNAFINTSRGTGTILNDDKR